MMLCDAAQSIGGKLYILGGGWSQVPAASLAAGQSMSLAIYLAVPWDQANELLDIAAQLQSDDGEAIETTGPDDAGGPVEARGQLEVGRPTGLKRGTPLDSTLALNFAGLSLDPGGYVWEFSVNGVVKARTPFRVLGN